MRYPNFSYERELWDRGCKLVAGADEVGRGAWAGPLFAAAVIFPLNVRLGEKIADSKKLTPQRREELAPLIKEKAVSWAIGSVDHEFINQKGIVAATTEAMRLAISALDLQPDFVLIDYFKLSFWPKGKQLPIKFGDSLSSSVAAASILAKVARDAEMVKIAQTYPAYGFDTHVGYGTKVHQAAIKENGLCPIHRVDFVPEWVWNTSREMYHA